MKYESVVTPAEWMAVAKRARKKHKFDVALLQARDFISKLDFKSLKELIVNRFTPHTRRWNGLRSVGYAFGKMSHTRCFTSIPWMMTGSSALTHRRGQDDVRGHLQ